MEFETAFLLVTILYFVFFSLVLVGYYIDISKFVKIPLFYPEGVEHDPQLLKRISYLYLFSGAVCYILLVRTALDGDLLLLYTTTIPRSQIFSDSQALKLGSQLLHIGYTVWLVAILANKRKPRIWHLFPSLPIVFLFFILGGRESALGIILNVAILLYYSLVYNLVPIKQSGITFVQDKLHFYAKIAVVPLVGVIMGFIAIIAGSLRRGENLGEAILGIDLVRILTAGVHNSTLDNLIATIEVVPDEFGYYYGTLVTRVLLNWIPRSIWSDKPVLSTGSELRRAILPEQSGGRPPGEIGRFYIDLGYPGIIIGALLTGLVLRYTYELLRKNGHSPVFLLIYAASLYAIVMGGLTNNALWNLTSTLLLLSPLIILDWWSRNSAK